MQFSHFRVNKFELCFFPKIPPLKAMTYYNPEIKKKHASALIVLEFK